jgi:hypothetical protein
MQCLHIFFGGGALQQRTAETFPQGPGTDPQGLARRVGRRLSSSRWPLSNNLEFGGYQGLPTVSDRHQ